MYYINKIVNNYSRETKRHNIYIDSTIPEIVYVQSNRERFYSTWENYKRLQNKSLHIQTSIRFNKKRHHWGSLASGQDEFTLKSTPKYIVSANLCESSIKLPTYGNNIMEANYHNNKCANIGSKSICFFSIDGRN